MSNAGKFLELLQKSTQTDEDGNFVENKYPVGSSPISVNGGAAPSYDVIKLSQAVLQGEQQNREKFTHKHELVTRSGLFTQEPGQDSSDLLVYASLPRDPFRQCLGSIFVTTPSSGLALIRNTTAGYTWKTGPKNENDTAEIPGQILEFNKKYLLPKNYYNAGISYFNMTEPQRVSTPNKPITEFYDENWIKLYFGNSSVSGYGDIKQSILGEESANFLALKLDLLSLFFTIPQKAEGYPFESGPPYNKSGMLNFLSKGSALAYDAVVSDEDRKVINALVQMGKGLDNLSFLEQGGDSTDTTVASQITFKIAEDILSKIESSTYSEHSFQTQAAISEETVGLFGENLDQGTLIADVKPVYNYFIKKYEDAKIPERITYNVYVPEKFAKLGGVPKEISDGKISNHASFANSVLKGCLDTQVLSNNTGYGRKSSFIVYDTESKVSNDRAEDKKEQVPFYNLVEFKTDSERAFSTAMRKYGIMDNFIETLITYHYGPPVASRLGMMNTNQALAMATTFLATGINVGASLDNDLAIVSDLKDPQAFDFFEKKDETYVRSYGTKQTGGFLYGGFSGAADSTDQSNNLSEFDFHRWLEYYVNELKDELPKDESFTLKNQSFVNQISRYITGGTGDLSNYDENENKFKKMINMMMFLQEFQSLVRKYARDYAGIMSREYCYSETLFYRIHKLDEDNQTVQNIFLTKPEESDIVRYIDSQVMYGKKYKYRITAFKAVVGSKYQYKFANYSTSATTSGFKKDHDFIKNQANADPNGPFENYNSENFYSVTDGDSVKTFPILTKLVTNKNGQAQPIDQKLTMFKAEVTPNVRIVEVPFYQESDVIILDSPPLPPGVSFFPIHKRKNNINITCETQTGEIEQEPILIESSDNQYFLLERIAQKRALTYPAESTETGLYVDQYNYVQPRLRFRADDFSSEYQVYRTTQRPFSYSDFEGFLYQVLDVNRRTAFIDNIQTNVKYYYTFRSRDMHGNLSNPTPVYQVEMVENSGVAYPVISILDMDKVEPIYNNSKSAARYLQIDASAIQSYLNIEASGLAGSVTAANESKDPVLGLAEKSLWNQRRFKIRIRSKNTGKAIDLNIAFKTRHDRQTSQKNELCD